MDKEIKRQLLMIIALIILISSTLVFWFDSFSFQTYTKITDEQLCFRYSDETLKIDGYEVFYKNEVLQAGGARIEGLETKKNDTVVINAQMNDISLSSKQTIKLDNQVVYLNYQVLEERLNLDYLSEITLNIEIQRKKKKVSSIEIELALTELKTYTGSNKNYSISNAYLTDNWFKAGYFHCIDNEIYKKYPEMIIDYMYLENEEATDYTRFIHIVSNTEDFLNGLTEVYFFDENNSLKDKPIYVFITLKGEDEFTFKIDLSPTINEGENS